jgi:hypothetical protein
MGLEEAHTKKTDYNVHVHTMTLAHGCVQEGHHTAERHCCCSILLLQLHLSRRRRHGGGGQSPTTLRIRVCLGQCRGVRRRLRRHGRHCVPASKVGRARAGVWLRVLTLVPRGREWRDGGGGGRVVRCGRPIEVLPIWVGLMRVCVRQRRLAVLTRPRLRVLLMRLRRAHAAVVGLLIGLVE